MATEDDAPKIRLEIFRKKKHLTISLKCEIRVLWIEMIPQRDSL